MSEFIQQDHSQEYTDHPQIWRFRWFILFFLASAFILSIISVIVVRNVLLGSIPASILLAMKPIVKWAFSGHFAR